VEDVLTGAQIPGDAGVPDVMEGLSVHRAWTKEGSDKDGTGVRDTMQLGWVIIARTCCTLLPDRSPAWAKLLCQVTSLT